MNGLHVRFRTGPGCPTAFDVDLDLPRHGITALFGPSGSGKTTCLRVIAGLDKLPGARVALGEEVWQDGESFVPVHRRALGVVFQEASLFPHLTVRANLEFGQKRVPVHERRFALAPIAALLGIEHLLARRPDALSGGERQRVAIARALLASPRLLLMDEPLAALDAARKQEILPYLERVRDELAIPILYVSHALDEVMRLADHLVLLDCGKVCASGPLAQVMVQAGLPAGEAGTVLDAVVVAQEEDGMACLRFGGGLLRVDGCPAQVGSRLRCRIRAGDVSLALARPAATTFLNTLEAQVTHLAAAGAGRMLVELRAGDAVLQALVSARAVRELGIRTGLSVWAQVNTLSWLSQPADMPAAGPAPAALPAQVAPAPAARWLQALRRRMPAGA